MTKYIQMNKDQEICDVGIVPNPEGATCSSHPISEKSLILCKEFLGKCVPTITNRGIWASYIKWDIMTWYERIYGLGEPHIDGHNLYGEYEISIGAIMKAALVLGIGVKSFPTCTVGFIQVDIKSVKKIRDSVKKK